jgi:hypothetical protein
MIAAHGMWYGFEITSCTLKLCRNSHLLHVSACSQWAHPNGFSRKPSRALRVTHSSFVVTRRDARSSRMQANLFRRHDDEHDHNQGWHDDLLQRLGQGPGRHLLARMAVELRYVGRPDVVSRTARLPSRGARSSWPRPIQPGVVRKRHGRVCRRSGSRDRGLGSQGHHDGGPLHWRRRSRALHRPVRHEACAKG